MVYPKGKPRSEKTKQKLSKSLAGRIPWNKGLTKDTDIRLLKASKKISVYRKGKALSEETKNNISKGLELKWKNSPESWAGRVPWNKNAPDCYIEHMSNIQKGENNSCWRGGSTSKIILARNNFYRNDIYSKVYSRDFYTCQMCGSKENLVVHHKIPLHNDVSKALDVDNCIALCLSCHSKIDKYRNNFTKIHK